MPEYAINNVEDAETFANRLMREVKSRKFQPMKITTNWGKIRSLSQNAWYFRSIARYVLPHMIKHPEQLAKLIKRALGNGLDTHFIHSCLKLAYLNGGSTKRLSTEAHSKLMESFRHDCLHDYGCYIPLPPEKPITKENI